MRAALLFADRSLADNLARAVEPAIDGVVDVFSAIPVRARIELVRRGDYDLLIADEPAGNGLLAGALALFTNASFAIVLRAAADLTNTHERWEPFEAQSIGARTRLSIRVADGLLVLTDATREPLGERYPIANAITVPWPLSDNHEGVDGAAVRDHAAVWSALAGGLRGETIRKHRKPATDVRV